MSRLTPVMVLVLIAGASLAGCVQEEPDPILEDDAIGAASVADILTMADCTILVLGIRVPAEKVAPLVPSRHTISSDSTSGTTRLRLTLLDCDAAQSGPLRTGPLQAARLSVPVTTEDTPDDGTPGRYLLWYADDSDDSRFDPAGAASRAARIDIERSTPVPVVGTVTWTVHLEAGTLTTQVHAPLSEPTPRQEAARIWMDADGPALALDLSGSADNRVTGVQRQVLAIEDDTPLARIVGLPFAPADAFPMDRYAETWRTETHDKDK